MKTKRAIVACVPIIGLAVGGCAVQSAEQEDPRMAGFEGQIGRTYAESVEDWPDEPVYTGEEPTRQGRYLCEMPRRLVYGSKFIRRSRSWKRGSSRQPTLAEDCSLGPN